MSYTDTAIAHLAEFDPARAAQLRASLEQNRAELREIVRRLVRERDEAIAVAQRATDLLEESLRTRGEVNG